MLETTLREITDAMAEIDSGFDDQKRAAIKLYDRARMLRDKGLLKTSAPTQQGRTTVFEEADIVAAVIAITLTQNGKSWWMVETINNNLRTFGNTQGRPAFEQSLADIKRGVPIYLHLGIFRKPWPYIKAEMGPEKDLGEWGAPAGEGPQQTIRMPVTDVAKPVLDLLKKRKEG